MKAIFSERLAKPIGPFSPAVAATAGTYIFISGQIGQTPLTGELVQGGVETQTEQALANLAALLEAAGRIFPDIVRTTIYLTDMSDFASVNRIYAKYFKEPFPARTTVAVAALPLGAKIEIEAIVGERM